MNFTYKVKIYSHAYFMGYSQIPLKNSVGHGDFLFLDETSIKMQEFEYIGVFGF